MINNFHRFTSVDYDRLNLAVYVLRERFHTPMDLVKYWGISGPCIEPHPAIEDIDNETT